MSSFQELQDRLGPVWRLNRPPGRVPHVCVVLPSYSVGPGALAHFAHRIPGLEHRFLVNILQLPRLTGCELVFLFSELPDPAVVDYYLSLLPPRAREDVRGRVRIVVVPGPTGQPLSARLIDRPDLAKVVREVVADRPVLIDPWNVTADEVAAAELLDAPMIGTPPHLWRLGYKSEGRRVLSAAGVPVAAGAEDVHDVDEVAEAIRRLRERTPGLHAVVVKHDNSVSGVGNRVVSLVGDDGKPCSDADVVARLETLGDEYVAELADGGVVESFVDSPHAWASPSVQLDITPGGRVHLLSTHDQRLGGEDRQVYEGCRFPADSAYAHQLGEYGLRVGRALARRGALGRVSADFVAAHGGDGRWQIFALELNLRKTGTTNPFSVMSSLLPGRYEPAVGWRLTDGSVRSYRSTDNCVDPTFMHLRAADVIAALSRAGLGYDRSTGTGVVLQMLSGLAIDGRFGFTALGRSPDEVTQLFDAVGPTVERLAVETRHTAQASGRPDRRDGEAAQGVGPGPQARTGRLT